MGRDSGRIFSAIKDFMTTRHYRYWTTRDEPRVILFAYPERWWIVCEVEAREREERIVVHVRFAPRVPEAALAEVRDFITIVDTDRDPSKFVVDPSLGTITIVNTLDAADATIDPELIDNVIARAIAAADRYFPLMARVAFGGMSAVKALDRLPVFGLVDTIDEVNDSLDG